MICTWRHGQHTYEFDATSRADELAQVRAIYAKSVVGSLVI